MREWLKILVIGLLSIAMIACNETEEAETDEASVVLEECDPSLEYSDPATFCQIKNKLLIPKCVACHSGGGPSFIGSDPEVDTLISLGWITPGDLENSVMYLRMEADDITNTDITDEELEAVRSWVLDGALSN